MDQIFWQGFLAVGGVTLDAPRSAAVSASDELSGLTVVLSLLVSPASARTIVNHPPWKMEKLKSGLYNCEQISLVT